MYFNKIMFDGMTYNGATQDPGGRSEILLQPPGPQQKRSTGPQPKFGNSALHILNPPLILFKLSLEILFKFFIMINCFNCLYNLQIHVFFLKNVNYFFKTLENIFYYFF